MAADGLTKVKISAPMDNPFFLIALTLLLIAAVAMAVHHAEVVALKVGEPFGTLILAICVTVIEVALIAAIMLSDVPGGETIARDAVFAAIMIVANGVVGLAILAGGIRHHELVFRIEGSNSALTVLIALAALTLVLPTFTTSSAGPTFTTSQLIFAGWHRSRSTAPLCLYRQSVIGIIFYRLSRQHSPIARFTSHRPARSVHCAAVFSWLAPSSLWSF
jgi:Ca2+/H+ antiporter